MLLPTPAVFGEQAIQYAPASFKSAVVRRRRWRAVWRTKEAELDLVNSDARVRRAAVEALARMGEYTALCVEDVAARLEDDDDGVRYAAARLLGEVRARLSRPALARGSRAAARLALAPALARPRS